MNSIINIGLTVHIVFLICCFHVSEFEKCSICLHYTREYIKIYMCEITTTTFNTNKVHDSACNSELNLQTKTDGVKKV